MKRSLVAATAVALLLTGCATGETGHLDPEIDPELAGPYSQPVAAGSGEERTADDDGGAAEGSGDGGEVGEGSARPGTEADDEASAAGGSSGEPANEVEAAFVASSGSQSWFADVTGVDVDGDSVLVTTQLTASGDDAAAVCEAVVAAARSTGITAPSVEVRTSDGETLSQLDAAAGDEGCSS